MSIQIASVTLLLFSATSVVAADMLPLRRGIYVEVGKPCKGASDVDILSYWGGRNGINMSKIGCTIRRMAKSTSNYRLYRTCTEIAFNRTFNDVLRVTVFNRTSFMVYAHPQLANEADRRFRYCGPKVQF